VDVDENSLLTRSVFRTSFIHQAFHVDRSTACTRYQPEVAESSLDGLGKDRASQWEISQLLLVSNIEPASTIEKKAELLRNCDECNGSYAFNQQLELPSGKAERAYALIYSSCCSAVCLLSDSGQKVDNTATVSQPTRFPIYLFNQHLHLTPGLLSNSTYPCGSRTLQFTHQSPYQVFPYQPQAMPSLFRSPRRAPEVSQIIPCQRPNLFSASSYVRTAIP